MTRPWSPPLRRIVATGAAALLLAGLASCSSGTDGGAAKATTTTTTTTTADGAGSSTPHEGGPVPNSTVSDVRHLDGPISGGKYGIPYLAMPKGWEQRYGYTEHEYFVSGDARAFRATAPLTTDGRWKVEQSGKAVPYKTRIVVRRPKRAADFNGTAVVEWLNVSAGRDSDPDFGFLADELLGQGYAYISVSAQKTGVEPGGLGIEIPNVPKEALAPLKDWDPERYGSLSHPGDAYSYDIFDQAAKAALSSAKDAPLGGLRVEHAIAAGESQSAFRMTTYIDAIQPITGMFDGFLVHSRNSSGAALNDDDDPSQKVPDGLRIRTDAKVPVFQFETETDLDFLTFTKARQDDDDHLVTWESAGTAHADRSTLDYGVTAGRRWTTANVDLSTECGEINDGPQQPIVQTAFRALDAWVTRRTRPPASPRIEVDDAGQIVRDADGIAKGGIRTPAVDAPVSVLTGKNQATSVICVLFGSTTPFTAAQLRAHYPGGTDQYVAEVKASADAAVRAGFLLPRHAKAMIAAAEDVHI